jgi:hypothetical protein
LAAQTLAQRLQPHTDQGTLSSNRLNIADKFNADVNEALRQPELQDRLELQ